VQAVEHYEVKVVKIQNENVFRSTLRELIAETETRILGNYTPLSWARVQSALIFARNVYGNRSATDVQINDAIILLRARLNELVPLRVEFRFTKTNDYLYLSMGHENFKHLGSAVFMLHRWHEATNEWMYIETATSSSDNHNLGLVAFEYLLTKNGEYRLNELQAPEGFRLPAGYWVVMWDDATEHFAIEARGTLSLVPAFRGFYRSVSTNEIIDNSAVSDYDGDIELHLYVGNFPEIVLPAFQEYLR